MGNHKWCRTVDSEEIDLFNPDPNLFTVDRIASTLARINRFAGHWVNPVSVARHSIRVADILSADGQSIETQLQGLFHDAAEAFTTDIPSPLKWILHVRSPNEPYRGGDSYIPYGDFEDALLAQIFARLEIAWPMHSEVHKVDHFLTGEESRWVRGEFPALYFGLTADPEVVALAFKHKANELFAARAQS